MNNQSTQNKKLWSTIIIVGLVICTVIGYFTKKREEDRLAEQNRQDAEAVGAFVGGILRELDK